MLFAASAQIPKDIRDAVTAQQAELALHSDPHNNNLAGVLLDFYLYRWNDPKLHAGRIHLLLWIIANRPDIDLPTAVHDARGLLVDPDDQPSYSQFRDAWMQQVTRQPANARVLANAAQSLRLTDRETAASWLKTALTYESDSTEFSNALAVLYAGALTGVAAMTPQEEPTRLDPKVAKSLFAAQVREEAEQDSLLSARTGWSVHLIAMQLRGSSLTDVDYDTVAEDLLLNAANLDYPKPSKLAFLAQFYRDQSLKVTHKILPKFAEVDIKAKEEIRSLVDYPKKIVLDELTDPVKIPLNVVIGVDGHVWKAESSDGSRDSVSLLAADALLQKFTFKPLRVSGEPVQVNTSFEVTIEPRVEPRR
jgi:hypothetical protein